MAHLTNTNFSFVRVTNTSDHKVYIPVHAALGTLREFCEEGCYAADPEIATLANKIASKEQKGFILKIGEFTLPNGITIYGIEEARKALVTVAEAYPHLWEDSGQIARVPEKEWMFMPLKPEAKPDPAKVYLFGKEDREFVDKEFDKLHEQGRLEWTRVPTSHSYPVFVVWRTVHSPNGESERKGRVVIDIIPLQSDITSAVQSCPYISLADGTRFFYQFAVARNNRHKMTVVSDRGQETFNVAIMGYRNSFHTYKGKLIIFSDLIAYS